MCGMIRYADDNDFESLTKYDTHISEHDLKNSIASRSVLASYENGALVGWLRFNLFWDSIPFMNMLYVLSEHRGKGHGSALVDFWEREMLESGYKMLFDIHIIKRAGAVFLSKKRLHGLRQSVASA